MMFSLLMMLVRRLQPIVRDFFGNALYKFTFYLLTYLKYFPGSPGDAETCRHLPGM